MKCISGEKIRRAIEMRLVAIQSMRRAVVFLALGALLPFSNCLRAEKVFSLFNVVRFPNDPCSGTSNLYEGICLTASECSSKVSLFFVVVKVAKHQPNY